MNRSERRSIRRAVRTLGDFPLDGSITTLGFGVAGWIESYLLQPDGDHAGEPFELTPEQVNFLLWFYAIDNRGRFLYRRGVLRRSKGWGKSPFLGGIALAELGGPVRFSHFDDEVLGGAVGMRHPMPWVVIAGVSETQTENTMAAIRAMAEGAELADLLGLDTNSIGKTRIILPNGGKIVPVTANAATQEGARPSFAIMDETHHWTDSNGGAKLARVIRRNLAKVNARGIETTNAHAPGGESVAERSYLAYLAIKEGRALNPDETGILYDSREAPGDVDLANPDEVREALRLAYGDATWVDLDRILAEVYDPDTPPEEARRFYLNQIVAAADSWVAPTDWHKNRDDAIEPLKLGTRARNRSTGDAVALGFDGSLTDDSTALVAVRIDDGAPFLLAIWEKPEGPAGAGWAVPKADVRDAVDWAFEHLDVVAFFSDVAYWETDIDAWRDEYAERLLVKATTRHAIGWDMRGHQMDTTRATEALHRALTDGEVPWRAHELLAGESAGLQGHEILTRHVLNGRRRINRWGVSFGKETRESPKKVDALAALMLARMARTRVLADPSYTRRRRGPGRLYGF
ncbi:terminase large subunit [Microbacterium phage Cen1621]|uniref:Terminase large subunit n=1 Tax=Microbacterium phage Cen1621 TaxID=2965191 RepID=A0A9E7QAA3_9CAUD|nr:terminase large subunit [Microbacterium phage Cen1621]